MTKKYVRTTKSGRKLKATSSFPILSIFRSNKEIYAQIIDRNDGRILASASSLKIKESKNKTEVAGTVGQQIAKAAIKVGIEKVVFNRGGNKYHGRVASLAKSARDAGLKF